MLEPIGIFLCGFDFLVFMLITVFFSAIAYVVLRITCLNEYYNENRNLICVFKVSRKREFAIARKNGTITLAIFIAIFIGLLLAIFPYALGYANPVYNQGWAKIAENGSLVMPADPSCEAIEIKTYFLSKQVCFAWEDCFTMWGEIIPPNQVVFDK